MIKENTVQLGPFPLGIDNKHSESNSVFDVAEGSTPRLTEATNFYIDDDGNLAARPGYTLNRSGTNIRGAWSVDNRLFVQEGANLYEKNSVEEILIDNTLTDRISICKHADAIFYTDGTVHKVLHDNTLYKWGIDKPTITVAASATVSSLPAGRYLVQASYTDLYGNEGPASIVKAVTLTAGQSISVTSTIPAEYDSINIYASKHDQTELNFITNTDTLPHVFSTFPNEADLPPAENVYGPVSNATGIFSFRSWLMMYKDNVIFRSESQEPHLFNYTTNIFQFENDINSVVPLLNGFWVGTDSELVWVADLPGLGSDQDTTGWVPFKKYSGVVYKGGRSIEGSSIPGMSSTDRLALFTCEDGVLVGKNDGSYQLITYNRYDLPTHTRSTIEFDKSSDTNKLLIGLVN